MAERDRAAVVAHISEWTREVFAAPARDIRDDTMFMDLEGADSIRMLLLLAQVEQHFGIMLMSEDLPVAQTVAELADQVLLVRSR